MKIFAGILFLIMMFIMPLSHAAEDTSGNSGGASAEQQSTGASGSGQGAEEEEEPDCE